MFKNRSARNFGKIATRINVALLINLLTAGPLFAAANYNGLKYGSKQDPFWLEISGALKLDQRYFIGKKDVLTNGANIRDLSLNFDGGINQDVSVSIGFSFDPVGSSVRVEDAYVTYSGLKNFGDNFMISVGKVNPSFCLENHSSGKWIPFLERSAVSNAFSPNPGLGFSVNKWDLGYSINASLTQPGPNEKVYDAQGNAINRSDRWEINTRLTKAFIMEKHKLTQVGLSANYQDNGGNFIYLSGSPEFKTRANNYKNYLSIGPIRSNHDYSMGFELLSQNGPFSFEAEYQFYKVNRGNGQSNVTFSGYRSNVNYVLTGEARKFKHSNGTLGQVIPKNDCGAWEISAKYNFLNFNDKDIKGGNTRNMGVAATWYANYNFATTLEYMYAKIKQSQNLNKLNIHTIAGRLQLVF